MGGGRTAEHVPGGLWSNTCVVTSPVRDLHILFIFLYFFSEARAGMFIDSAGGSVVAAVGPFISFHESGTMLVNAQALWHALHRVASSTGSQTTRRVEESDACICNRV